MAANRVIGQPHEAAEASSLPMTQSGRMRGAVEEAVAVAPSFLRGDIDADHMAKTMVHAVRNYTEHERAAASEAAPQDAETEALQGALAELMACGSGYLAGRCDGACVARTMTQMVQEFATHS